MRDKRVTASIVRTSDGDTYTEYRLNGIGYGSRAAIRAALEEA